MPWCSSRADLSRSEEVEISPSHICKKIPLWYWGDLFWCVCPCVRLSIPSKKYRNFWLVGRTCAKFSGLVKVCIFLSEKMHFYLINGLVLTILCFVVVWRALFIPGIPLIPCVTYAMLRLFFDDTDCWALPAGGEVSIGSQAERRKMKHKSTHTQASTHTHIKTWSGIHILMDKRTHPRTHTHTHTHTNPRTHTHTLTYL